MDNLHVAPHKSTIMDIDANILCLIIYILPIVISFIPVFKFIAWMLPIAVLIFEKNSIFIRFHAIQSILLILTVAILKMIFYYMLIGLTLGILAFFWHGLAGVILTLLAQFAFKIIAAVFAIIAGFKAYDYSVYYIPVLGRFSYQLMNSLFNK